ELVFTEPVSISIEYRNNDPALPANIEDLIIGYVQNGEISLPHHQSISYYSNKVLTYLWHFSGIKGVNLEELIKAGKLEKSNLSCAGNYVISKDCNYEVCHTGLVGNRLCDIPICRPMVSGDLTLHCCARCPSGYDKNDFPCESDIASRVNDAGKYKCVRYEYKPKSISCNSADWGRLFENYASYAKPRWDATYYAKDEYKVGNRICAKNVMVQNLILLESKIAFPMFNGAGCEEEWNDFIDKLSIHEMGHIQLTANNLDYYKKTVNNNIKGKVFCAESEKDLKKVIGDEINKIIGREDAIAQKKYDDDTQHGCTQGAKWPPDAPCR
ncbi:MAG: hypothetical protein ACP5KG_13040, partial [Myxococcota bacterium]